MISFGKQIAIEDQLITSAATGGKIKNLKKKEAISMLQKLDTNNPAILSQIEKMQKNLDNTCNILHDQYNALYNILEYLNSINKPESSKKIMAKILELEEEEKNLKSK